MGKSQDVRWFGEDFWRGVASGVVSALITAYMLFVVGASVAVAAKGPAGSEVELREGLFTLLGGVFFPFALGFIVLMGYKAIDHSKSFHGRIGRLLRWPFLFWTLGCASIVVAYTFYFVGLFAVIQIRISK
jgi:hypothetical protein